LKIIAEHIFKSFGENSVLKDVSFSVKSGQCLAITGKNGSGKSTLMRVLSNLIQPSKGKISIQKNDTEIKREDTYQYIGFVGPYLEMYQDLTAEENLIFFSKMKEIKDYQDRIENLMKLVGLAGREQDQVKTYSSGMKQRLKYVFALLNEPEILFIDEPRSNLDEQGIETIYSVVEKQKKDKILILATNDRDDLQFADLRVDLNG
jgi:heme exporter protein A